MNDDSVRAPEAQHLLEQKMQAVGRLAARIAHDFNNILTTIGGMTSLVLDALPEGEARSDLNAVMHAVDRGAVLTRQLLVFSRQHPVFPEAIDLNALLLKKSIVIGSLLREDITFNIDMPPHLGTVHADEAQLELIISILVENARDAMPSGGALRITTANFSLTEAQLGDWPGARTGDYVALAIRDNGTGMNKDVKARLFEPFFTTKEVGKGAGLGLTTVYGIVRQSGGFIRVESELREGTTVTVLLPRV